MCFSFFIYNVEIITHKDQMTHCICKLLNKVPVIVSTKYIMGVSGL